MQTKNSNLYTIPLLPGQNAFNHPGRFFRLIESPVPITVKLGDMSAFQMQPGQGVPFPEGEEFIRYELINSLPELIVISYWCGYVDFTDDRRDNIESRTEVVGRGITQILGNTTLDLIPQITGSRTRRKALIVSNLDPAVSLLVSDFSAADAGRGNLVTSVFRESSVILPISEPCRLRNDTGAPVSCVVSDVYWLR